MRDLLRPVSAVHLTTFCSRGAGAQSPSPIFFPPSVHNTTLSCHYLTLFTVTGRNEQRKQGGNIKDLQVNRCKNIFCCYDNLRSNIKQLQFFLILYSHTLILASRHEHWIKRCKDQKDNVLHRDQTNVINSICI